MRKQIMEVIRDTFFDAAREGGDPLEIVASRAVENWQASRPAIVVLCGSTRFWKVFQLASLEETLLGRIVLSIGAASGTDEDHFGNLSFKEYEAVKLALDELHLRKIDLADNVYVLNVGGYIGESTRREIEYARKLGKPIRYLEATGVAHV